MNDTSQRSGWREMAAEYIYNQLISIDKSLELGIKYKVMQLSEQRYTNRQYRIIAGYFGDSFVELMNNQASSSQYSQDELTEICLKKAFDRYENERAK